MRVAIVGLGAMGKRHLEAVRSLGFQIAGVCDVRTEAFASMESGFDIPPELYFSQVGAMLRETKPDCLVIATTAATHCEYTEIAARAGTPFVLCEKPMATSLGDCDRMIQACRNSGTVLSVNHQMRFMEYYTIPMRMISGPEFGGLTGMTVVAGNVGIAMNVTHFVEAFRLLSGEDAAQVTAWFSPEVVRNPRGAEFEDRAGCLRVLTTGGKRLYVDASADQGHGINIIYCGRYGSISINGLTGELTSSHREAAFRDHPTTRYGMPAVTSRDSLGPADLVSATARSLGALVSGGDLVTGSDARKTIAVIVGAYQSAERGGIPIPIDENLDHGRRFPWA